MNCLGTGTSGTWSRRGQEHKRLVRPWPQPRPPCPVAEVDTIPRHTHTSASAHSVCAPRPPPRSPPRTWHLQLSAHCPTAPVPAPAGPSWPECKRVVTLPAAPTLELIPTPATTQVSLKRHSSRDRGSPCTPLLTFSVSVLVRVCCCQCLKEKC